MYIGVSSCTNTHIHTYTHIKTYTSKHTHRSKHKIKLLITVEIEGTRSLQVELGKGRNLQAANLF